MIRSNFEISNLSMPKIFSNKVNTLILNPLTRVCVSRKLTDLLCTRTFASSEQSNRTLSFGVFELISLVNLPSNQILACEKVSQSELLHVVCFRVHCTAVVSS